MDIILLQDVEKVGTKYEVVNVKDGFGRNYLIPQGLALIANESNRKRLGELRRREEEHAEKQRDDILEIKEKLEEKVLKIGAKVGTSEKIFGSVTNVQLANALEEQLDIKVDRRNITIPEEVKTIGTYVAGLDLHKDIDIKVHFEVVQE